VSQKDFEGYQADYARKGAIYGQHPAILEIEKSGLFSHMTGPADH
jgi:hypothetical protein